MKVSASFLKSKDIPKDLTKLNETDVDFIHVDIADGKFVKSKTMPFKEMRHIYEYTSKRLDVHLMVENIDDAIEDFLAVNPNIITFHYEACKDKVEVMNFINKINLLEQFVLHL